MRCNRKSLSTAFSSAIDPPWTILMLALLYKRAAAHEAKLNFHLMWNGMHTNIKFFMWNEEHWHLHAMLKVPKKLAASFAVKFKMARNEEKLFGRLNRYLLKQENDGDTFIANFDPVISAFSSSFSHCSSLLTTFYVAYKWKMTENYCIQGR